MTEQTDPESTVHTHADPVLPWMYRPVPIWVALLLMLAVVGGLTWGIIRAQALHTRATALADDADFLSLQQDTMNSIHLKLIEFERIECEQKIFKLDEKVAACSMSIQELQAVARSTP